MKSFKVLVKESSYKNIEYFIEAESSYRAKELIENALNLGEEDKYDPGELFITSIAEVESVIETDSMGLPV